jgi:type II secretory pathway component GspD/PulD (secretin)
MQSGKKSGGDRTKGSGSPVAIGLIGVWSCRAASACVCRRLMIGLLCVASVTSPGCRAKMPKWWLPQRELSKVATFADHYEQLTAQQAPVKRAESPQKLITISTPGMPLSQFALLLSNETGASIVVQAGLDQQTVAVDLIEQTLEQTLHVVARRLGVEVTKQGTLFYIGSLRREDRGLLVRRVRRLNADELRSCVQVLQSEQGAVASFSDGLLVIGDRVEVLTRIDELLTQVEQADSATWVLQLYLVSLEKSALRDLGFDARPSLEVASTFAAASASSPTPAGLLALNGGLNSVLRAAANNSDATLIAEPLFYLSDGADSEFSRGENVPVARKAVTGQGVIETTSYQNIKTGLVCKVALRELRADAARLTLDVSLSDIVGFVEQAPRTREDRYTTQAEIQSGGVYLLGSLVRQSDQNANGGGLRSALKQERNDTVMQVWGRAYRVGAAASSVEVKN